MVRLALIGCAESEAAYRCVKARIRGARFAAVADSDLETAHGTAEVLGAPIQAPTLDELLARHADAFDAVVIDQTSTGTARLIRQAAHAGKHVLAAMPLGPSTRAADEAVAACRSAGVCLMAGQTMRFMDSHRRVKQSLESGNLGNPGALRIHDWGPPPAIPSRRARRGAEARGGMTILRAVRDLDLAVWLFGTLPTALYATGRGQSGPDRREADYVQIHLGFPDGGMALIDRSIALPQGPGYFSLTMVGSRGAAYVDGHHNVQLLYRPGEPIALETGEGHGHVAAQLQEFIDAIDEAREPAITGADGRAATQVVGAALLSMTSGRAARLAGGRYELV